MSLELKYPKSGSASYEVTLRSPLFGNEEVIDLGTVNRKTRSGEAKSIRPTGSPTIKTLKINFEALSLIVKDDFKDFVEHTAGLEIYLKDHDDNVWHGIIAAESIEIITSHDTCSYGLGFEFVGVKQ